MFFGRRGGAIRVSGKVTALGVYQNNNSYWPVNLTLSGISNSIGVLDVGGGNSSAYEYAVTASSAGALGGATAYSRTSNLSRSSLIKIGADQTVESFSMNPAGSYAGGSLAASDGSHFVEATAAATVTMLGTDNRTNDWLLKDGGASKAMSLVWNPTGDYTYTCVGHTNTIYGTITVSGGTFVVGDSCSFPNVTAITVGAGAVFSNDTSVASSLRSLTSLTLGAGAKAYLPADALTAGSVTLTLDPTSEVVFPDGTEVVTFANIVLGGNHLISDTYTLLQVKGASLVANLNTSGIVDREAATWDGGGEDKKVGTKENWAGDTLPLFDLLGVDATFGTSGDEAVADGTIRLNSVVFDAPGDFTLSADDGARFKLGNGGVTGVDKEDAPHTYTIAAPVVVSTDQNWHFGTNALPVFGGSLYGPGYEGVTNTVSVSAYNPIWAVGHGQTDYVGKWRFYNRSLLGGNSTYSSLIFATGVEPFGGAGATVSIAGGRQSGTKLNDDVIKAAHGQNLNNVNWLIVSNATVSSAIDIPYSSAEDRYGVALFVLDNTTNVFNGTVNNLRQIRYGADCMLTFNGPVNLHPDNLGDDQSLCFRFQYVGTTEISEALKRSKVVFNGRVTYPDGLKRIGRMDTMAYAEMHFNASSNVVAAVGTTLNTYFTLYTGADYAFAEGRTILTFRPGGASYLYLDGHSQHIGSISGGHSNTEISSTAPATLRVNQTNDVVYAGFVSSNIVFVKEGAAQLGFSKAEALKGAVRVVEGTLAPEAGALASSVQLAFEGGTLSLPEGETVVHRVDYLENSELKSLPKGTYSAGDKSKIGSYLTGSGTLRVRTSDVKSGLAIFVR